MSFISEKINICAACVHINSWNLEKAGLNDQLEKIRIVIWDQLYLQSASTFGEDDFYDLSQSIVANRTSEDLIEVKIAWIERVIKQLNKQHVHPEDQNKLLESFWVPCGVCDKIQKLTECKNVIDEKIKKMQSEQTELQNISIQYLEEQSQRIQNYINNLSEKRCH